MKMLKVSEVAVELSVSRDTVLRMIQSRAIHAVRVGRQWRVSEDEVRRVKRRGTK